MKKPWSIAVGMLALVLAGCLPEERFWWAPSGSHAVVRQADGLYLAKADGKPGVRLALEVEKKNDPASQVSWLPDGSGFAMNRTLSFATWAEAKAIIPADEAGEVERFARSVPLLLAAWSAAAQTQEQDSGPDVVEWMPIKDKEVLAAAFFLAFATQPEVLEAELRKGPNGEELLKDLREEEMKFRVHEICVVRLKDGAVDGEPRSLARSLRALINPKVSPREKVVAFLQVQPEGDSVALAAAMLDGSSRLVVSTETSAAFDWTADGHSLVYSASAVGKDSTLLQRIQRVEVVKEDGSLRAPRSGEGDHPGELRSPVNLAMALMPSSPRVVALPDGRVLFASQPATFPAAGEGLELVPLLFTVTADGKTVTPVPTAPGDLPANLGYFVASPDGKRVAVVESDTDAVAVVEIESGKTEIVSPPHPGWQGRTLPAWKTSSELTFAALKGGAPKWMLWKQGEGVRSISDQWPAEITGTWLEEKKKEPQPAEKSP
jgi:hypothetical protein